MANKARGEVDVKLGGKSFVLAPTTVAILEVEEKAGLGIAGILQKFQKSDIGLKTISALVFGGMVGSGANIQNRKALSYFDVCELVRKEGVHNLIKPCSEFLVECITGEEEKKIEEGEEIA